MRYAALLRAVNVGGRKVTMRELREALDEAGYADVQTLQAAGSLVLETKKTPDTKLEAAIEAVIEKTFGIVSEVMVRNPEEWKAILKANPFFGSLYSVFTSAVGRPASPTKTKYNQVSQAFSSAASDVLNGKSKGTAAVAKLATDLARVKGSGW